MTKTDSYWAKWILGYIFLAVACAWLCWYLDTGKDILGMMLVFLWITLGACLYVLHNNPRWLMLALGFFLRNLRPVVLYHYKGPPEPLIYSLARYDSKTDLWLCPVYWGTNTGRCVLKPRGLVSGIHKSSYIIYWRPLRKTELMMHLFTEVEHVWGMEAVKRHMME